MPSSLGEAVWAACIWGCASHIGLQVRSGRTWPQWPANAAAGRRATKAASVSKATSGSIFFRTRVSSCGSFSIQRGMRRAPPPRRPAGTGPRARRHDLLNLACTTTTPWPHVRGPGHPAHASSAGAGRAAQAAALPACFEQHGREPCGASVMRTLAWRRDPTRTSELGCHSGCHSVTHWQCQRDVDARAWRASCYKAAMT
jgi:hypothetical protein